MTVVCFETGLGLIVLLVRGLLTGGGGNFSIGTADKVTAVILTSDCALSWASAGIVMHAHNKIKITFLILLILIWVNNKDK